MNTRPSVPASQQERTVTRVTFSTNASEVDNEQMEVIARLERQAGELLSLADYIRRQNARRNGVNLRSAA
jgi:hypothetical protein